MKNIVLLTYYFPPGPEVGGLRAMKVAESFVRRGAHVHVVTAAEAGGAQESPVLEGMTIHRVRAGPGLRGIYQRMRNREQVETANAGGGSAEASWKPPERTGFLKRQVSSAMWLPDDRQGWILPGSRKAAELARTGCDLIYSTGPPATIHMAGYLTSRRAPVRWVAEFRDPWTDNPAKPAFVRSAWSDAIERFFERRCLRAAQAVVAVTDAAAGQLSERLGDRSQHKLIVARNGIDILGEPGGAPGRPGTVVYLGSLYHGRDPRPFLGALATLRSEGELPAGFKVELIGHCRWHHGVSVEAFVREHGLEDTVTFVDTIPHEQALARMHTAGLLLLLAQNQPLQVPNKLYEYLGSRHPIIAFADPDGETARMLRRVGGHYVIDRDDERLVTEVVRAAVRGEQRDPATPDTEAILEEWTTARQFEHLHSELDRIFGEPGRDDPGQP